MKPVTLIPFRAQNLMFQDVAEMIRASGQEAVRIHIFLRIHTEKNNCNIETELHHLPIFGRLFYLLFYVATIHLIPWFGPFQWVCENTTVRICV